ncbi:hypothetical protein OAC89_01135 [Deltaproteobacteria bacterium]|nr:hypothetical protein [Deltaproteobacteria bacterium]
MKIVNWDKCKNWGIIKRDITPKDIDSITIKSGMRVSAKYKGHRITLKIIDKTNKTTTDEYRALVIDVDPLNKKKLDDLSTDDEVFIDRKYIYSITE